MTAVVELSAPFRHKGRILGTNPLVVETSQKPWSYGISLPVVFAANAPPVEHVVFIRFRVLQGSIGIACLTPDGQLLDETVAEQGAMQTVPVIVGRPAESLRLLVRNGPHAPSAVEIYEVTARVMPDVDRGADELPTLRPMAGWSRFYGTMGTTLAEKERVRHYFALSGPKRLPWIEGLTTIVQPHDQLSRALYVSGLYEPNTLVLLKHFLRPGAIFYDVGAHVGMMTMPAARWVGDSGHVYSFEPSTRERARLEEHVAINRLSNVTVVPSAVSNRTGTVSMRIADAEYGGLNTLGDGFAYPGVHAAGIAEVAVLTLDEFREKTPKVDVIKIDVEGAEYLVLDGARNLLRRDRPVVVFEFFPKALAANGSAPADVERLFRGLGYGLHQIDDETAELTPVAGLSAVDEQNMVAVPKP